MGRLNVVLAEGKDPRLVVDSSICNVNLRCTLPEKVALPMASDVKLAHLPDDPVGAFTGASFDFKAAHKQIQVRPEEHGLLLFARDPRPDVMEEGAIWGPHLLVRVGFRFRGRYHCPDFGQAPEAQEPTPGTPPGEEDPQTSSTAVPGPTALGD